MTSSDVSTLRSSLGFWEIVDYIATGIVLIGVAGESVAEFLRFPKDEYKRTQVAKLSALILIVGLAGELVSVVQTSRFSGQLIAISAVRLKLEQNQLARVIE